MTRLRLPMVSGRMMRSKATESQKAITTPPLIAVVDDDESCLRSVGRLLRSEGYSVETFSSAGQFLSSLLTTLPQCLVLDVHMPEMTGLQLQEVLAAQGYRVPIIFLTANDTPQIREQARRAGAIGFLQKPFHTQALLVAVDEALRCQ
jgi:FixJ family two-component response regulator